MSREPREYPDPPPESNGLDWIEEDGSFSEDTEDIPSEEEL